jgi:hypothetical protein
MAELSVFEKPIARQATDEFAIDLQSQIASAMAG